MYKPGWSYQKKIQNFKKYYEYKACFGKASKRIKETLS